MSEQILLSSVSLEQLNKMITISVEKALKAYSFRQNSQEPNRTDIHGAIEETGYTKNTIYKLVHENKIPFHKPTHGGSRLIFFRTELREWLKGAKKETSKEFAERKVNELTDKKKGVHGNG